MPLRADIAMNLGRALLAQGKIAAANESFTAANAYWLDYDATNRCAGQAAYWLAQGHLAAGCQPAGARGVHPRHRHPRDLGAAGRCAPGRRMRAEAVG